MADRPFAAARFLSDYGIPQGTPSREYLNIACCFCGGSPTSPFPLGIHVSKGFATCWRCSGHPLHEVIQHLTGSSPQEAREILDAYAYSEAHAHRHIESKVQTCEPPGGPLTKQYRDYLGSRGFDPDWVALEHGVLAAGPRCFWDAGQPLTPEWKGQWFSNRLIIPIHDATGRVVNFQGRSILRDEKIRYKGARVDMVPMHHKRLLYGAHRARKDLVVVVEGVMDQWKLGRGVVATFGTSLTVFQLVLLSKYRRVLFCFDSEETAQAKAMRWAREVVALGSKAEVVDLELGDRDAGDLSEVEAAAVRRELGLA